MTTTSGSGRILIIDDEESVRNVLSAILRSAGYAVESAGDGQAGLALAKQFQPHLAIVDLQMPRLDGIETLKQLKGEVPRLTAIILTAHGSIQSAVDAMRAGAYDYLSKPLDNNDLLLVVSRAMERALMSEELNELRAKVGKTRGVESILGESAAIHALRSAILRAAPTDVSVLIEGESGSGKELVARALHHESKRRNGPFVAMNCAAIPQNLAEAEFFGHEKGAFTDAREQRIGKFEEAGGGSIFLDEVAELPNETQAKFLRVLQEKEFTRIGGNTSVRADVRVIAATNRDLARQVEAGKFREDLFFRLNVLRLTVPPLRDHSEDIPGYVRMFIARANAAFGTNVETISGQALEGLKHRQWRGNIRQLENEVQRAVVLAAGERLELSDFPADETPDPVTASMDLSLDLEAQLRKLTDAAEQQIVLHAMQKACWNRTRAAKMLGISRRTLFDKLQRHGLVDRTLNSARPTEHRPFGREL